MRWRDGKKGRDGGGGYGGDGGRSRWRKEQTEVKEEE